MLFCLSNSKSRPTPCPYRQAMERLLLFLQIKMTLRYRVYCSVNKLRNSLWPSDAIWRQGPGSTLAQVMACCLTAPSHYLNPCWLISSESNDIHIRAISQDMPQPSIIKICLKITCLKFNSNFPGANELINDRTVQLTVIWDILSLMWPHCHSFLPRCNKNHQQIALCLKAYRS